MAGIIVHEWLETFGGAENVFSEFMKIYPEANSYCLWNDDTQRFPDVKESWLSKTQFRRHKAFALPFMIPTWRNLPFEDAEWILISSHLFAHHARFSGPARKAPKFVYAHTPARYIWSPELDKRGSFLPVKASATLLRKIDSFRAAEISSVAANSKFVAERIKKAWGLEAKIIFPPVDTKSFAEERELSQTELHSFAALPSEFILGASRFVEYKNLSQVLCFGAEIGMPVVLAGAGPEEQKLRKLAESLGAEVYFVIRPTNNLLANLLRKASVLVYPAIEDFGILPVEAMACGTPVISQGVGGVSESVKHGVSGVHVLDWSPGQMQRAFDEAIELETESIIERSRIFDSAVFEANIKEWVRVD